MRVTLGNGQILTKSHPCSNLSSNRLGRGVLLTVASRRLVAAEGGVALAAVVGSPTKRHAGL